MCHFSQCCLARVTQVVSMYSWLPVHAVISTRVYLLTWIVHGYFAVFQVIYPDTHTEVIVYLLSFLKWSGGLSRQLSTATIMPFARDNASSGPSTARHPLHRVSSILRDIVSMGCIIARQPQRNF